MKTKHLTLGLLGLLAVVVVWFTGINATTTYVKLKNAVVLTDISSTTTASTDRYSDVIQVLRNGDIGLHIEITDSDSSTTVVLEASNFNVSSETTLWHPIDTITISGAAGSYTSYLTSTQTQPEWLRLKFTTIDTLTANIALNIRQ